MCLAKSRHPAGAHHLVASRLRSMQTGRGSQLRLTCFPPIPPTDPRTRPSRRYVSRERVSETPEMPNLGHLPHEQDPAQAAKIITEFAKAKTNAEGLLQSIRPSPSGEGQRDLASLMPSRSGVGTLGPCARLTSPTPTPPLKGRGLRWPSEGETLWKLSHSTMLGR